MLSQGNWPSAWLPWMTFLQVWKWWLLGAGIGTYVLLSVLLSGLRPRQAQTSTWATRRQIIAAGLTKGPGVIVGQIGYLWWKQLLRVGGEENYLVIGPARSGKSAGVIIPTLLSSRQSVICLALKPNLVSITTPQRSSSGPVYIFDPIYGPDRLNPFDLFRWGFPVEVDDVQRGIEQLTYVEATQRSDAGLYYLDGAQATLIASTIYVRKTTPAECHPAGVRRFLLSVSRDLSSAQTMRQRLEQMRQLGHRTVTEWADGMLGEPVDVVRRIISAALRWLRIWQSPLLERYTKDTTIDLHAFQQGARPSTLYLRISPEDIHGRYRALARTILELVVARISDRDDPKDYRHEVLVVLDDFAELDYLDVVERIPAFLGESGFRLLAAAQSFGQIFKTFGENSSLFDNCGTSVMFKANAPKTARFIAEKLNPMLQHTSVQQQGSSRAKQSESQATRPLLNEAQIMSLSPRRLLIITKGLNISARPVRYFSHPWFTRRAA